MELYLRKGPEPTTLVSALAALKLSETRLSISLSWIIGYHTELPATLQKELQRAEHLPDSGVKSRITAATAVSKDRPQEPTLSDDDEFDGPQDDDDVNWQPESELLSPKKDSEVKPELGIDDLVDTANGKIKIVDIRTITDQPESKNISLEDVKHEPESSPLYPCRHCEATFESAAALSVHDMLHAQVCIRRMSLRQRKVKQVQVPSKNTPRVYCTRRGRNGKVPVKKTLRRPSQRITNSSEEFKYRGEISEEEEELAVQFKCEVCSRTFPSMLELRSHVTRVHPLPVPCEVCESRFKSRIDMEDHQKAQHPEFLIYNCDQCENRFLSLKNLHLHRRTKHRFSAQCDLCKSSFRSRKKLEYHKKAQHPELLCHKCDQCEERFLTSQNLKFHKKTDHPFPKEGMNCWVCGKFFDKHNNLRNHLQWNHVDPSKLLLCPTCGVQVKNKTALRYHMLVHAPPTFICQTCGFGLKNNCQLKRHMLVHSTERPHKCSHCPLTFKNETQLNIHVDRHLGKGIKACQYCGIEKTAKDLFNHILIVHKGRKYKCSECSAMFSLRAHLKNHFTLKHPDRIIPADADLEVIYTKTPEVTSTPAPPPAKRSRGSQSQSGYISNARARATEAAFTGLSCAKCPRATFHTRTDMELHLLRHEKDPEYRMRHRVPVRRLGQSPSPPPEVTITNSDSVDPDPPQLQPPIEQPTQAHQQPSAQFPLQAAGIFDNNAGQYQSYPNIHPYLQLHQPSAVQGYGNFPNYDTTVLGNGHLYPGNQG